MKSRGWLCIVVSPWFWTAVTIIISWSAIYSEAWIAHPEYRAYRQKIEMQARAAAQAERQDSRQREQSSIQRAAVNQERRAQLVAEAGRTGFLNRISPQDARLWRRLVSNATLDEECNLYPECINEVTGKVQPVLVQMRDDFNIGVYTVILGTDEWTPSGHRLIPQITYYLGDRHGRLWRIESGADEIQTRNAVTDSWSVMDPDMIDVDRVRNDARTALMGECPGHLETM